ncbi:MAG: 2-C-methyl-D-erythritol 4-phosphate cytidylyltransferase [Ruminiclostridium sp.]|nr:2-C-methyl-D-erythritol 4-phosphate cytidylyltransferase [Ruminiclostridium sp.]
MTASAIILAAGASSRMQGTNKQLLTLGGVPVILRSALNFQNCPEIIEIIIAARAEDCEEIERLCRDAGVTKLKTVCEGGKSRAESAEIAFSHVEDTDVTAIHDGARPFAYPDLISMVISDAMEHGGAIAAVPVKDTIKITRDGFIESTPDRSTLYSAQTPQAFRTSLYRKMLETGGDFTDDSQLAERLGIKVKITAGSYNNIKITTPEDIALGEAITEAEK